jgi:transcriptional regulator with XRE-family HTH domain
VQHLGIEVQELGHGRVVSLGCGLVLMVVMTFHVVNLRSLSPSTLSRIETGHRRISLDQLSSIARALGSTLDQLVESVADDGVVIRPQRFAVRRVTTWLLSREPGPHGVTVAKMRVTSPATVMTPATASDGGPVACGHGADVPWPR